MDEVDFNGEMYQDYEPTPPPPTPPPSTSAQNRSEQNFASFQYHKILFSKNFLQFLTSNLRIFRRRSTSLPLPPPPLLTEEGDIVQNDSSENEAKGVDTSSQKYFFAPLKSKRKGSVCPELRPDVLFVNNILPSDGNRLATIRKPHNPLKYPSNLNAASIDPEVIPTVQ